MDQGNVQSKVGVTLVGAGVLSRKDLVDSMALAPFVVAADGGANQCLAEGYLPSAVIGDFDSILPVTKNALSEAQMIEVSEQETTDFEKCLTRIDAPFVLAVGFGGRLDHLLTVLSVMARQVGPPVILISDNDISLYVSALTSLNLSEGTRLSLFPLAPVEGRSTGLRWPIDGLRLEPTGTISTSNEATGAVTLDFDEPGCLVILPRSELTMVLPALRG